VYVYVTLNLVCVKKGSQFHELPNNPLSYDYSRTVGFFDSCTYMVTAERLASLILINHACF
jgi:hypothetical protein